MGVVTAVRHSEKWLSKHEGGEAPRFSWQTKDVGYGDTIRITDEGKIEQLFRYGEDYSPWIDILYDGHVSIYSTFPDKRWVEYEMQFIRGVLNWIELVYDGSISDRFTDIAERAASTWHERG